MATHKHNPHGVETEKGAAAFSAMNAERLIAEAREHRLGGAPEFTPTRVLEGSRLLLEFVLSTFDYEEQISAPPAMVARSLAALVAHMEDSSAFATRQ